MGVASFVLVGLLMVTAAATSPVPAGADDETITDPDDSSGALDIASASHGHGNSERFVRHTLTTYEAWDSSLLAASEDPGSTWGGIFFTLNSRAFCCGSGSIIVKANPDGSLYAIFRREGIRAYGRAWRPDDRSVTVEFAKGDFARKLTAYKWQGISVYASPDNPECLGWMEATGPRWLEACRDYTDETRHEVAIEPDLRIESIHFNPSGRDMGRNGHINREYVVIENHGPGVNLKGWELFDRNKRKVYVFGSVSLGHTERVYVYSGRGEDGGVTGCDGKCHTTLYAFWGLGHYVWANRSDTATLQAEDGKTIDRCSYGRRATSPYDC